MAGQETLSRLLADRTAQAPEGASPLASVAAGLKRASSAIGPMNRELSPRLKTASLLAPSSKRVTPSRASASLPP